MQLRKKGTTTIVKLPPRFVGNTAVELAATVRYAMDEGLTDLTVDLSDTVMADSSAIGTLVALAVDLRERNGSLRLCNLSAEMQALVDDGGLGQVLSIEGSPEGGVEAADGAVDVKLRVEKEERGSALLVRLDGIVSHPLGSNYLREQLLLAMENHRHIVLDVGELTFFDSLGVGVLIGMEKLLARTGGSLRVCGARDIVRDLFATLRMDSVIPVHETVSEALAECSDT